VSGDDPYRSSPGIGACPRCKELLDGNTLACPASCGEFVPRDRIDAEWPHAARGGGASSWPIGAAACPICKCDMVVVYAEELRFDRCDTHGVWLDAGEAPRFFELMRRPLPTPRPLVDASAPPTDDQVLAFIIAALEPYVPYRPGSILWSIVHDPELIRMIEIEHQHWNLGRKVFNVYITIVDTIGSSVRVGPLESEELSVMLERRCPKATRFRSSSSR
jgi:Zn-finger nucleic acid-binding protein